MKDTEEQSRRVIMHNEKLQQKRWSELTPNTTITTTQTYHRTSTQIQIIFKF